MSSVVYPAIDQLIDRIVEHFEARSMTATALAVEPVFRDAVGPGFDIQALGYESFADLFVAVQNRAKTDEPQGTAETIESKADDTHTENAAFEQLAQVAQGITDRGQRPTAAVSKPLLRDALGGSFAESSYGYSNFRRFVRAAADAGYVTVREGEHDFEIFAADKPPPQDGSKRERGTAPVTRKAAGDVLLRAAVEALHDRGDSTFAGNVKARMLDDSGREFDEKALGFHSFTKFLEDAEVRGLVSLRSSPGMGPGNIDVYPVTAGAIDFPAIRFGYSSASAETIRDPELLRSGYYDPKRIAERLRSDSEFLVLGYKGSGKSSIGEHLRLLSEDDPSLFVDMIDLRDFPLESLAKIVGAPDATSQLQQLGWAWLLLLRSLQSLMGDAGADGADEVDLRALAGRLEKAGLLPSKSVKALSLRSAELALGGRIPSLLDVSAKAKFESVEAALEDAVARLRSAISQFRTPNRHLIVLDGLDELITPDLAATKTLSALLSQTESLNEQFLREASALKIVLLCRLDLFERIPSPNKNKVRQDFSIVLDWYDDSEDPELLKLIRQRAQLSGYDGVDPIGDFFPRRVRIGTDRDVKTRELLLAHTRHTPRDLVSALTAIQRVSDGPTVAHHAVRKGLEAYSTDYFVPELKDELHGYLDPEQIEEVFGLLSGFGRRVFALADVEGLAKRRGQDSVDILSALSILFDCSAVGHEVKGQKVGQRFRYEFPNLSLNPDVPFVIHRGAWRALNLEDRPSS